MKIYNTLSRKLEEFNPINPGKVTMYGCGITPYKPSHLGHAMQGVIFDVIRRYFEHKGYGTIYVRNYTDIDDKIVAQAKKENIHPLELSQKIIRQNQKDFAELRVKKATFEPKVSDHINGIIHLTKQLLEKRYAYVTSTGNVYYSVRSFEDYGKLSNQNIDCLEHGVRKDVEEDKKDPLDFALWKSADESERLWDSPWGHGRPGWHIECSVMSAHFLGNHFDIHGGGADLIFPHHENEIAQSEGAHGNFANYWIHNGLLMVGNDKMSKSLNNDIPISTWLEKYHPDVIRYMILTNHYRSHVKFDLRRYVDANKKVYQGYKTLLSVKNLSPNIDREIYTKLMSEFEVYMDRDFNTVEAVAMIHGLLKEINKEGHSSEQLYTYYKVINSIGEVLGLFDQNPKKVLKEMKQMELRNLGTSEAELSRLLRKREHLRKKKKYKEADKIAKTLRDTGVKIIDNPDETSSWEPCY